MPRFPALKEFISYLESIGELKRITRPVDPHLEITEIARRALQENKPALLFEHVKGSQYPLAINVYASEHRIELALERHPGEIGEELIDAAESLFPPKPSAMWQHRSFLRKVVRARSKNVHSGFSQECIGQTDLSLLPIQFCWPNDGGKFITQGQVFTYDPLDGKRNVGVYRMHVYDRQSTGMHWQIQKGGGFHYYRAEQLQKPLEVGIALGTDPALLLAAVAALPEGIDEVQFASFLRGNAIPVIRGKSISISVPANAEFVLEGIVPPSVRREEGPYGDHFGHYSNSAPFPVFNLTAMTHRKNPIYPATVVGIPPMEDKYLGDATQMILAPLSRMLHKEIRSMWAYYESGFHNLLVVSVETRYRKEAMKTALGLLGTGQLALTKCLVLVSEHIDPRNWQAVLKAIGEEFDPHDDFVLIPNVPLDTLDFSSFTMELGSKMILDATKKTGNERQNKTFARIDEREKKFILSSCRTFDRRINDIELVGGVMLIVKVRSNGRSVVEKLVKRKELQRLKIIAAVSHDIDIRRSESYIWGIFTRFDCERDVIFSEQTLRGISPIYNGVMGIDATWKKGYPLPLSMDPAVVKKVDDQWESYWQ